MDFKVVHRRADVPARKARYVVDLIRGLDVNRAIEVLTFTQKRATRHVRKLLNSAIANASQVSGVNVNSLYVKEARVDGGPIYPARFMPGPMGRALPVRRKTSHIHITLTQRGGEEIAAKQTPAKAEKAKAEKPAKETKAKAAKKPAEAKKGKK